MPVVCACVSVLPLSACPLPPALRRPPPAFTRTMLWSLSHGCAIQGRHQRPTETERLAAGPRQLPRARKSSNNASVPQSAIPVAAVSVYWRQGACFRPPPSFPHHSLLSFTLCPSQMQRCLWNQVPDARVLQILLSVTNTACSVFLASLRARRRGVDPCLRASGTRPAANALGGLE